MKKEIEEGDFFGTMILTVGGWKCCGCIDPIRRGGKDEDRAAKLVASKEAQRHSDMENMNHGDWEDETKDSIDVLWNY
eukprot:5975056-Ditylum_brightwellii.AAC.1